MQLTTANTISPQQALATYIECEGLLPFALEKLNKAHDTSCPNKAVCQIPGHRLTELDLTELLASKLDKLQDIIRAKTILSTFQLTQLAITTAQAKLGQQEPFEMAKTASNLIRQLAELTDRRQHNTEININQLIHDNLPDQEARDAWLFLTTNNTTPQPTPNQVIEHASS